MDTMPSSNGNYVYLYHSQSITCQMKSMDFFVWQGRSRDALDGALKHAIESITGTDAEHRLKHCGFALQ
jgi:hypothetical protein